MDHGMGQQQRKSQSSSLKKMGKMAAFAVVRGGSSLAKGAGYVAAAAKGKLAGAKELDGGENVEVTHPPTGNAIDRARKKKSQQAYQQRTPNGSQSDLNEMSDGGREKKSKRRLFNDDALLGDGTPMSKQEHSELKPSYGTIS